MAPTSVQRLRLKLKGLMRQGRGCRLDRVREELRVILIGWLHYFSGRSPIGLRATGWLASPSPARRAMATVEAASHAPSAPDIGFPIRPVRNRMSENVKRGCSSGLINPFSYKRDDSRWGVAWHMDGKLKVLRLYA